MLPERKSETKEPKTILKNAEIRLVGTGYELLKESLADHYFRVWAEHGLCESFEEASRRLDAYSRAGIFETSYVVTSLGSEKIYALLLTTQVRGESVLDILQKISKYSLLEFPIPGKDKGSWKTSVCFSVTAERGFRVQNEGMPEDVSLSEFLLFGYPVPEGSYKTAYSRFAGVGRRNPYKFYLKNVGSPWAMGPTGMHEGAYGGLTLAIVKDSRPEDISGGGVNTFVLLPTDENQKQTNAEIIARRKEGFIPYEKIGPVILLRDAWPYLSLAR